MQVPNFFTIFLTLLLKFIIKHKTLEFSLKWREKY